MSEVRIDFTPISLKGAPVSVSNYFQELDRLILSCIVTDADGAPMSLDHGCAEALIMFDELKASGRKIMLVGNGGSAAIASHEALDFWNAGAIKATAFNDSAQLTCLSNDYGYDLVYSKAVEMFADPGDLLIAISSSGKSVNILNAVSAARAKNCSVITYSGFAQENPLRAGGDLNFYLQSTSYGHVEVGHLALIHYLTDMVKMNTRGI